jgi:hypothetical protein
MKYIESTVSMAYIKDLMLSKIEQAFFTVYVDNYVDSLSEGVF